MIAQARTADVVEPRMDTKTMTTWTAENGLEVKKVAIYEFVHEYPRGCKGGRYKVHRFVLAVPSYQANVLVECLLGKDRGLWFVCSLNNFSIRYQPVREEEP